MRSCRAFHPQDEYNAWIVFTVITKGYGIDGDLSEH